MKKITLSSAIKKIINLFLKKKLQAIPVYSVTKNKRTAGRFYTLLAVFLFAGMGSVFATYFPSSAGGSFNSGAAWSQVSCGGAGGLAWPTTSVDDVSLSCAKTVTLSSSSGTCGAITISGGTLVINSGCTLTCTSLSMSSGTLTVNGTLNVGGGGTGTFSISGGTFTSSATGTVGLTAAAQNISSTQALYNLNIAGSGNKTMLSSITVTNQLQLTTNNLIVGSNTLTLGSSSAGNGITQTSGKITFASGSSFSMGGSYTNNDISTIISNSWPLSITNFTMTRNLCNLGLGTSHNLTVTGAFTLTQGKFSIGASTLTLNGSISGNINGQVTGGSTSDLVIGGSGTASMYFDLTSTGIGGTNTIRNFTNTRTSNSFTMLSNLRIGGTITESASTSITITTASIQTLTIDGVVSGTAPIVGNSGAFLSILGSGSLGGAISFVTTQQLSNLTINRTSSGTATLSSPVSVSTLTLTSGVINNGSSNIITVTGATSGSVTNTGGSASYVAGALEQNIPPNSSSATYTWPIGKTAYQKFILNGITTTSSAGNVIIKAEAFDGNSGGSADPSMTSVNTDNYWNATVTQNSANISSIGTVALTDATPTLVSGNVVGYSPTLTGAYYSLGGTVSAPSVTSTNSTPVVLGYYDIGNGNTSPLCGTYTVGPTGNFASLTSAVNSLNSRTVTCDIIFELQSTYTSASESFPITITQFTNSGGPWTATFRPKDNTPSANPMLVTSGDPGSGFPLINLNGADNIILDGRPGGTGSTVGWTIRNTRTASLVGPAIQMQSGANTNTLQYLQVESQNTQSASGTVFITANASPATTNTGDIIQYCNITNNTVSGAAHLNAICAYGNASTQFNNNMQILNNNISNFTPLITTAASGVIVTGTGLNTSGYGSGWTISGNSFFKSISESNLYMYVAVNFIPSPGGQASTGNTISNNFIGGNASALAGSAISGTWATAAAPSNQPAFQGITVNANSCDISGNVIGGVYNYNIASQSGFTGIYVPNADGTVTISDNIIGSTYGAGNIYFTTSTSSVAIGTGTKTFTIPAGLSYAAGDRVRIGTQAAQASIYSYYMEGTVTSYSGTTLVASIDISFGSGTLASWFVNLAKGVQSSGQWMVEGIWVGSGGMGTCSVTNNTVGNLVNTNGNSFVTAGIITQNGGPYTITGNTVYNLTNQSAINTSQLYTGNYGSVVGISQQSIFSGVTHTVSNNTVYNLHASYNSSNANAVYGIELCGVLTNGITHIADGNFVHSLSVPNAATGGLLYGIFMRSGTYQVSNNMVRLGIRSDAGSITCQAAINGIIDGESGSSTGTKKIYHNSVFIGGTGVTNAAVNSYAFRRNNSNSSPKDVMDVRNNIFVNNRSNSSGTTGKHYCIGYDGTNNLTSSTEDYNECYGIGTGFFLGQMSTTDCPDYTALRSATTNSNFDLNSLNSDPQFQSPVAASPDLHIDNSVQTSPVDAVSGATALVANDFDALVRASYTPVDLGATAFIASGCTAPTITLSNTPIVNAATVCFSSGSQIVNFNYSAATGTPTTYSISGWSGGTFANVSNQTLPGSTIQVSVPASTTAGTYTATLTVAAGSCTSGNYTISVIVNALPTIGSNATPSSTVCNGTNVTLSGTGAASYTWSGGITNGSSFPASSTTTYTVTGTDANTCQNTATTTITVNQPPTTSNAGANQLMCISGGNLSANTPSIGTGAWSITGGPSASSGQLNSLNNPTATFTPAGGVGNYTLVWTISNSPCTASTSSVIITVVSTGTWLGTVSNDWFNSSNWCGGIPTSSTNVTIPSTAANQPLIGGAGAVCNSLTINSGASLTMNSSGAITISGNWTNNGSFIPGNGIVTFGGTSQQSISGGAIFDNLYMNNASGLLLNNNVTVNATLELDNGNITTGSNVVTVENNGSVIPNNGFVNGNLKEFAAAGQGVSLYYPVGSGSDYAPLDLFLYNITTGGYITVNTTAGDNSNIGSSGFDTSFTVNRNWNLTNNGVVVDQYDAGMQYVSTDADVNFNGNYSGVKIYNAGWTDLGAGYNSSNYEYISGVTGFGSLQIGQVNPVPVIYTITPAQGGLGQTLDVVFDGAGFINGVSSVNVGTGISVDSITVNSEFMITAHLTISSGTTTGIRNFSVTNAAPFGGTSNSLPFNVIVLPVADFTANTTIIDCYGDGAVQFTNASTSATSYLWNFGSGANPSTATGSGPYTVTYSSPGLKTVSLTATNSLGSDVKTRTDYINVNSVTPGSPGNISGQASLCGLLGTNLIYNISAATMANSYVWTVPAGVTLVSGQGSTAIVVNYPTNFTSGSITVHAINGCGSGNTVVKNIGVTGPATPGAISGPSVLCNISSAVYSVASVQGASSYNWTVPAGITISSGAGTNTIHVALAGGIIDGDITVQAVSSCGNSGFSTLSVAKKTAAPGAISGPTSVCGIASTTYSIAPVFGASSYAWTLPSGITAIGSATGPSISVSIVSTFAFGQIKVAAVNSCGSVPGTPVYLYGTPIAPVTITGPNNVCGMTSASYTCSSSTGANSYTWILPQNMTAPSLTITGNTINVTISGMVSGSVQVKANSPCASSSYRILNITSAATAPGPISGPTALCNVTTATYSVTPVAGAISYDWVVSSGVTIIGSSTGTSIGVSFAASVNNATIKVATINACGNISAQTALNVSKAIIPGAISGNSAPCPSTTEQYCISQQAGVSSYSWAVTGGNIISNTGTCITVVWPSGFTTGTVKVAGVTCVTSIYKTLNVATGNCISPVSFDINEAKSSLFNLYPNPTSGIINLTLNKEQGITSNELLFLEIYDVLGKRVLQSEIQNAKSEINATQFENGMYFIRVVDLHSNTIYTQRFIKE